MSHRIIYLICATATMLVGLASRRYRDYLPTFLGEYGGDMLWATMLYLLVSFVLASRSLVWRCIIAMSLAFAVEVSQLYHAAWIDNIRNTTLGGLVLGFGFLWTDFVCYAVGIATGALLESWLFCRAIETRCTRSDHC